jgi:hypothetical protein
MLINVLFLSKSNQVHLFSDTESFINKTSKNRVFKREPMVDDRRLFKAKSILSITP